MPKGNGSSRDDSLLFRFVLRPVLRGVYRIAVIVGVFVGWLMFMILWWLFNDEDSG